MRQLFTVTSTVTQWTQSVTDSNTMHYSLASRHNFASFRSCDFYCDKRWQNDKRVYKEFFVNVDHIYGPDQSDAVFTRGDSRVESRTWLILSIVIPTGQTNHLHGAIVGQFSHRVNAQLDFKLWRQFNRFIFVEERETFIVDFKTLFKRQLNFICAKEHIISKTNKLLP